MPDQTTTIQQLRDLCQQFRQERGWSKTNPATFAKDIAVEAGELLDHFVWDEEAYLKNDDIAQEVKYELVDVLYAVLMMSQALNVDLSQTLKEKLKILAKKYPASECRKKMKEKDAVNWIWNQRKKFKN